MQLRATRLTAIAHAVRRAIASFSPASLFAANEPGVWYDPSDLTTMFQDAAGTTPVTAVEQGVGLLLDKSRGLVLGPEVVANGAFDSSAGWTLPGVGTNAISSGQASLSGATGYLYRTDSSITSSRWYRVQFTVSGYSGSGTVRPYLQAAPVFGTNVAGNGTFSQYLLATTTNASTELGLNFAGAFTGTIDNISVKELPGAHASQTTATSRPVLSARVNLLTNTESFDDGVWTKSNATITANAATAPSGLPTADKLVEDTTNNRHQVSQNPASTYPAKTSVYAKKAERDKLYIGDGNIGVIAVFDLTTGTVLPGSDAYLPTIQGVGDGWYLCSITRPAGYTLFGANVWIGIHNGTSGSYLGDGTSGIYIWGADLRPANQASLPYQRVNTASDYDTVGFPYYLKFDGIDDSLVTPTITPGVDKVQVFAGVRKLSEASVGLLVEMSAGTSANGGSFLIASPGAPAPSYYAVALQGSSYFERKSTTVALAAPVTNVLAVALDFAQSGNAEIGLRANGSVDTLTTVSGADAGTGNFQPYPLYIGRRNNASLPFNGHLYPLIVRFGPTLTADQITQTETYVAGKTGVTL